jgi:hypothetical protein
MQLAINKVKVVHAWESNLHLTGIPPHINELVDLHALKVEQSKLAGTSSIPNQLQHCGSHPSFYFLKLECQMA